VISHYCNKYDKTVHSTCTIRHNNKDQSHLAQSGVAVYVLFGGMKSHIGSSTVPLDRALLSSYRLSTVSIPQ